MSEVVRRERLQPSLLDRLTDDAPEQTREAPDQQSLTMLQLRRAVLRDLGWLLNTTSLDAVEQLDATPRVAVSCLNFGVPGFAGRVAGAGQADGLDRAIADAIRAFEPRIRPDTLQVQLRDGGDDAEAPRLTFEIQGELWALPLPQQLFLETSVEIETRLAVVTEAAVRR